MDMEMLKDRYRGCLLWGAVGDALGRVTEGVDPETLRERFPEGLQRYVPWKGWRSGPVGTITDDTQLTMEVARSLLATGGQLDPADFVRRLVAWLPTGRGKGRATTQAVEALGRGEPWWRAGVDSAGNGAAMRAAPVGLAWAFGPVAALRRNAELSALPTHTNPVAVAGAVAIASGTAWCIRAIAQGTGRVNSVGFLRAISEAIAGMETAPVLERKPGGRKIRLADRIGELDQLLKLKPDDAFAYTYNGAFALESVPAALYSFLRSPDDPRQVILTAVNAGYDADTVASMAGNLAGAWCGAESLRTTAPEWWDELEYREELIALADGLLELAVAGSRRESGLSYVQAFVPERLAPVSASVDEKPFGQEEVGRPTESARLHGRRTLEHFTGCLLGGAVGDALGAPVEFMSLQEIRDDFGPKGIREFAPAYGRIGAITDDTQMSMFTAEGLIRAANRFSDRGICNPAAVVYRAYLRWLHTQGQPAGEELHQLDGWLIGVTGLHARRAPGDTCLAALQDGRMGTLKYPVNDSKGCGGVMRAAPVGLIAANPFDLGCLVAAITHGHPSGYLSAGVLAAVISSLIAGQTLEAAIHGAVEELKLLDDHREVLFAVNQALELAASAPAVPETVERLGAGWVAEEALAISLFCALKATNFLDGVMLAVNHSGDSDSTGAITGNILGTLFGREAIPERLLAKLELRAETETLAQDLFRWCSGAGGGGEPDWQRYPPW